MYEDDAAAVSYHVASALSNLHLRGLAHRDVKLANILLSGAGDACMAKLADFDSASELNHVPSDFRLVERLYC